MATVTAEFDDEAVGARLKMLRAVYSEKQAEFAARFGMSPNQYNQYENGKRHLPVHHAIRVAAITGVTLDWLYRDDVSGLPVRLSGLVTGRTS
ncbi:helix-turn-helix domain-containing protein [Kaistia dalseonensis]|uniref:helix-turn-helix domain-containing protein n=1 Tax=Kaistia dalseonensis TaxID=410840 RepID=UPI0035210F48